MNRLASFGFLTVGGIVLILVSTNTTLTVVGWVIAVSAAAGTVWAYFGYRNRDKHNEFKPETHRPSSRAIRIQIASAVGVTLAGIGLILVANSTGSTILAW